MVHQQGGRLLLVDDDTLFVSLMSDFLSDCGFEVMTAGDGLEGLAVLHQNVVDLVIADIMMPRMDGFEMIERMRQEVKLQSIPVVMLSAKGETGDRIHGLRAGADAYLVKPFELEELTAQVEALLRYRSAAPADRSVLVSAIGAAVMSSATHEVLTPTEKSVLRYVAVGMLNKEIAKKLSVSTRTVESHVRSMLQKTSLDNRTALARWAMEAQLV